MAYQATAIPVMIASPGDVSDERSIAREVLHDWNDVNASANGVVLVPTGWETHSSPELGTRPQQLINSRVLKGCDLLIAVFWTRLGTPTGEAPSGTVEEILEHIKLGKPAMLYFSSRPAAPQTIDADQFRQLQAFRVECEQLGLIETYENLEDFRRKLAKQLPLTILHNSYLRRLIVPPPISPEANSEPTARNQPIPLSNDSRAILKAAAKGDSGTIINVRVLNGHYLQAGSEKFGGSYGRESARWEAAVKQLVDFDLVVDKGFKNEIFELTARGWRVADEL